MVRIEKPNCYVASPYGFAESTKTWYDAEFLPLLRKHVKIIDPWAVNVDHILDAPPEERPKMWVDLGERHYRTIGDKAQLMVAGLDQEPPDNGTVSEVVWAAAYDIPVIAYRGDFRTTGEEGLPYNLMIAAAIKISGGITVANLVELESAVEHYAADLIQTQASEPAIGQLRGH